MSHSSLSTSTSAVRLRCWLAVLLAVCACVAVGLLAAWRARLAPDLLSLLSYDPIGVHESDLQLSANASHTSPVESLYPLNVYRLTRLFDRLQEGQPVAVGVVGGSNSAGHGLLTQEHHAYHYLLRWLNDRFPTQPSGGHTLRNHARPATTSAFAGWCLDELIPNLNGSTAAPPIDLLLVDYAANDGNWWENFMGGDPVNSAAHSVQANMERLTRRVLRSTASTALMFVYFTRDDGRQYSNVEEEHEVVARRYGVPSVSLRAALQRMRDTPLWSAMLSPYLQYISDWGLPGTNSTMMRDPAHASDIGHHFVFDLMQQKLEALLSAYVSSGKRSLLPSWIADAMDAANSTQSSGRIRPLPLPAPSIVELAEDAIFSCRFLPSHPLEEAAAFELLTVNTSVGWQSAACEHASHCPASHYSLLPLSDSSLCFLSCSVEQLSGDKFAIVPDQSVCNATAGLDTGCWLSFRLSTGSSTAPLRAVSVLFTRSWRSIGDVWAWLSCSSAPRIFSSSVSLLSLWPRESTQTSLQQIFSATDTAVWEAEVKTEQSTAADPKLFSARNDNSARTRLDHLPCALDTLTVFHKTPGPFQLIGYLLG